jgi:hypothetical protein
MSEPAEGPVCVEITIAPDEEGAPFSASGVLFLRATVRAANSLFRSNLYNFPLQDSVLASSWKDDIHRR